MLEKQGKSRIEKPTRRNLLVFAKKSDFPILFIAISAVCISCVAPALSTIIFGKIFKKLAKYLSGEYENRNRFLKDIQIDSCLLVVLGFGKMFFNWIGVFFWMKFGETQLIRARKVLYSNIFTTDHEWFENKSNLMGEISQINRSVEEFRVGTASAIGSLISTIASIIAMLVTAFVQSWSLTLVILASTPIMVLIAWFFGNRTFKAANMENDYSAKASKILDWNLTSGSIVRLFNGKYIEIVKFNKYADLSRRAYNILINSVAANNGFLKFLILMTFVQGFWFGNYMILTGKLHINQVFTCFSACMMLGMELSLITTILACLNKSYAAIGRICDLIDETRAFIKQDFDSYPLQATGSIDFQNVYFSYKLRADIILNNISFSIKPYQFNYIIGLSGSGKSTIANLIIKFYKCELGSILIDGHNVNMLSHSWITDNITLIQQNPVIFNDTLRINLAIAGLNRFDLNDIPDSLITQALEISLLKDDVKAFDKGLDTVITGSSLSGGQQQRLSIARAYIRDTPILILDETFSALDKTNKDGILKNLKSWRKGKTTIIITHEYQYIEPVDHVIELQEGQIKDDFKKEISIYPIQVSESDNQIDAQTKDEPDKSYHYLSNPAILKDLEDQYPDDNLVLMSVISIARFFVSTNELLFTLILGLIASLVSGVMPPIFSFFFSRMLAKMVDAAIGVDISKDLVNNASILVGIVVLDASVSYLSHFILGYVSEAWIVQLRKKSFAKLLEQDITFLNDENKKVAELTSLILNDTRDLRVLASEFLSLGINIFVMLFVGIIWSLVAGWKLALVGISFVPVFLLVTMLYSQLMSFYEFKYKDSIAKVENHNHSTVLGIRSIYSLNLSDYFMEKFNNLVRIVQDVSNKRAFATGFGVSLSEAVTASAFGACIYYGMVLVSKGQYNQSQLLQVITILTFTMANAAGLLGQLPDIARAQRSGTLIIKLLSLNPSVVETEGDIVPGISFLDPIIMFKNLEFGYGSKCRKILRGVSFAINRNETVAVIGPSGSGKSTIASLLLRLYQVKNDTIFIQNYDINRLNIDWIRDSVSIVPQFSNFFEGSIYENLVYGILPSIRINEKNIIDSLQLAGIYDFVQALPEGVHSRIGEAATSLYSAGQMQRLSIARALIRQPKVLIMDECTSNLDPENTKFVIELIKFLKGKFTIILITHDPAIMAISTRLIKLKDGEITQTDSKSF